MKKEYNSIDEFLEDIHGTISLKETVLSMGLLEEKDFKGTLCNCIFHANDDTPSLQVTDNFFKCYACCLC